MRHLTKFEPLPQIPALQKDYEKRPSKCSSDFHGSGGGIRTRDQLINSQLRYRCATPEYLA